MPRIRTVKPAYPKHRKVRAVCRDARLLNIHLWNLADDEGRLQELPQWIIGEVFPTDEDVTPVVLREWLGELEREGLIVRYEADGESYIQCHNFREHQVINKPKASEIPPPNADPGDSRTSTGQLPDDSRPEEEVEEEKEGKGNAEGEGDASPAEFASVLARLDAVSFARQIAQPKVSAAVKVCAEFADRDLTAEVEKFAHYWIDGPGEKRPLSDVAWAWRNWMSRVSPSDSPRSSARDTVTDDLRRLEAEASRLQAEEAGAR